MYTHTTPGHQGVSRGIISYNDEAAGGRDPAPGEENEEDVEGIKQQLRTTKQESLASTRNALRLAHEAEETARNTVTRLGSQSGE